MPSSLLQQLHSFVVIDVDSMDPDLAHRHSKPGQEFDGMTSNQALVFTEASRPENVKLVREAIDYVHAKKLDQDQDTFKMDVIDTITVLLGKRVLPYLKGSVHAQTSPSVAYDTEKTIAHAKKLVALFEDHGIPKERVCIKIPATPESIVACQYLQKIGIQTLGTCLFSLPQALAASQAGCKCISPYFNDQELRAHLDKTLWKEYSDPATESPMSMIILSIIAAFREIKSTTLVMPASIITPAEVIALASLQPHHITIPGPILDKLAALPAVDEIKPTPCSYDVTPFIDINYVSDGGKNLHEAIASDIETQRKVKDALLIFDDFERKIKEFLETVL